MTRIRGESRSLRALSNHRHLCFKVMDKVDLRRGNTPPVVSIISQPPPAATQTPGVELGGLRKSSRTKTPAAVFLPSQAAQVVRQERTPSGAGKRSAPKAASVKQPEKRVAAATAKGGGGRPPRAAKERSTAPEEPLSVAKDTYPDVEPEQDSTTALALGALASGGRSISNLAPPLVETPRFDEQGLQAQMAIMGNILINLPAQLEAALTRHNVQQALAPVPTPQGRKRPPPEQGEGTPLRSPPNSGYLPCFQRPEGNFTAPTLSPNTERLQALAEVEDRYNDRVRSAAGQPGEPNGASRQMPFATYARGQMYGGAVGDSEPEARERANNDVERHGYGPVPPFSATRMPNNDPLPMVTYNYHYHGDSGVSRPSHGPLTLQPSARPRGRFPNTPTPFQGQMQMQMQNATTHGRYDADGHYYAIDGQYYLDGYPNYNR